MIPYNIKTRIYPKGKLHLQLNSVKQLFKEYPNSRYAKIVLKKFRQKFWLGSNKIKYNDIISDSWNKILPEPIPEIIEIGKLKFAYDDAFKAEYADIFIAGGEIMNLFSETEKIIACKILTLLSDEGPYESESVKIKENDVVIDAGANIGLFSLLCSQKNVKEVYAFEPQKSVINLLKKNILLNNLSKLIKVVPFGLSDNNQDYALSVSELGHAAGSIVIKRNETNHTEKIHCVTLDKWVIDNKISKIDFLKADIEGAERNLLLGATEILKKFAPRLAICTYHFPDDPVILPKIILDANPNYIINQTSHKLFAFVPENE